MNYTTEVEKIENLVTESWQVPRFPFLQFHSLTGQWSIAEISAKELKKLDAEISEVKSFGRIVRRKKDNGFIVELHEPGKHISTKPDIRVLFNVPMWWRKSFTAPEDFLDGSGVYSKELPFLTGGKFSIPELILRDGCSDYFTINGSFPKEAALSLLGIKI